MPARTIRRDGVTGVAQSWEVACPGGSVLTGGGFKVEPPIFDDDANANVDLAASRPIVVGGIGTGWRLQYIARREDTVRRVTAYARCAGRGLRAIQATEVAEDFVTAPAISEHDFLARCRTDGITTAGGYQHDAAHWLTPHPVFVSRSAPDLRGWQVKALGAFQHAEAVNNPTPPCDPNATRCLHAAAFASCYAPPDIDSIIVQIVSPPN